MRITRRGLVLGILLLASVITALNVSDGDNGIVDVAERKRQPSDQEAFQSRRWAIENKNLTDNSNARVEKLLPRRMNDELISLFPSVQKIEKIETEEAVAVIVEPIAPQLPFKFFGKMLEDEQITLFLSMKEKNIIVRAGDTIDGVYRVESIRDGIAEFIYLPMQLKQTLVIGGWL